MQPAHFQSCKLVDSACELNGSAWWRLQTCKTSEFHFAVIISAIRAEHRHGILKCSEQMKLRFIRITNESQLSVPGIFRPFPCALLKIDAVRVALNDVEHVFVSDPRTSQTSQSRFSNSAGSLVPLQCGVFIGKVHTDPRLRSIRADFARLWSTYWELQVCPTHLSGGSSMPNSGSGSVLERRNPSMRGEFCLGSVHSRTEWTFKAIKGCHVRAALSIPDIQAPDRSRWTSPKSTPTHHANGPSCLPSSSSRS